MSETNQVVEKIETVQLQQNTVDELVIAELTTLANNYKNLVVTADNLDEANEARLKLYRPRIEIQRIVKFNNDILNKAKKRNQENGDKKIAIIEPVEKDIEAKIAKVKEEAERKKREAEEAERKRIADIKASITNIEGKLPFVRSCSDIQTLDNLAMEVQTKENSFSEFNEQGNEVVKMVLQSIVNRKLFIEDERKAAQKRAEAEREAQRIAAEKQEKIDNAVQGVVVAEEVVKQDIEAANQVEHHPHEIGSSPDVPENVFPKEKPELPKSEKKEPFEMELFSAHGYHFGISSALPKEIVAKIKSCITEIVEDMEF